MLYLTGDTHGNFQRFGTRAFPQQKTMNKKDYVIVCGDFGIWDKSAENQHWMDWLENKPFTTLFVAGNHSNYDLLAEYPTEEWNGGRIQRIRPSVIHLMRGQVFNISGKRVFTMGGASSHDIQDGILEPDAPDFDRRHRLLSKRGAMFRINHLSWWKEELPSEEEYREARANLDAHGWRVDYVVTHCCPSSLQDVISGGMHQPDPLTNFFEELKNRLDFQYWFFGHYHDDRLLQRKYLLLYQQVVNLEEL